MNNLRHIDNTVEKILKGNPDPVVRYLLLRDVIGLPANNKKLITAKRKLNDSLAVKELKKEQWQDGGWGTFHGIHTSKKQMIPTTEVGVSRAIVLGLDSSHPILVKVSKYIVNILQGKIPFPDRPEKNARWETGKQLFLASTLSLINPSHPILDKIRKFWLSIAQHTFQSGRYSEDAEISIHKRLTGATVKDSYLVLKSKYHLTLLSGYLPAKLESIYIHWIWNLKSGIGYLEIPFTSQPPFQQSRPLGRWFTSMELLSRFPRMWKTLAKSQIDWLWKQRNNEGLWDFGTRSNTGHYFPLSDNWRIKQNRIYDWSTRVLILLRRYSDAK